jgi:hypothetical protein
LEARTSSTDEGPGSDGAGAGVRHAGAAQNARIAARTARREHVLVIDMGASG